MPALLFGSISTLADTSELQRESFNAAFAQHGLDWSWDREQYVSMLGENGGRDRVSRYAEQRGEQVDADAVHATKSEIFQQRLAEDGASARPGVVEAVAAARAAGFRVGLVTTTSPANLAALGSALAPELDLASFDVVVDAEQVDASKPDPAAYAFALSQLGEDAAACVAVEDNLGGVQAARAAGIACVAFPNANTADADFDQAERTVDAVDFDELRGLAAA